jgi:ubiquinone/menaquinone biosynthesis C-methylase UbiE
MSASCHNHFRPGLFAGLCAACGGSWARRRVVPEAEGIVVEAGIGGGVNLPLYDRSRVKLVIGVDPDLTVLDRIRGRRPGCDLPLELYEGRAESLPFDSDSADTIVLTYTACSIPDIRAALGEMRRVLKSSGRLLFCEHGRSHDRAVAELQDRLDPVWRRYGVGCHINRDIARLLDEAGFRITWLDTFYGTRALRPLSFHYSGAAVRA